STRPGCGAHSRTRRSRAEATPLRERGRSGMSRTGGVLSILLLLVAAACSSRPPGDPKDYATKVAAAPAAHDAAVGRGKEPSAADRPAKAAAFGRDKEPIADNRKAEFLPLAYFPIDPEYHVPASLKPSNDRGIVEMTTSAGNRDKFRRVGALEFTLRGQQLKLS